MRRYETVFIANPDLSPEERQPLFDKLNTIASDGQGFLVKFDEWGHRRLAYEVEKQTRGYYVLMDFCGDGSLVKELERNMRLDDRVLKYMTVLVDNLVDVEALKAQIEAAKEQIEAAKEQKPEPEPAQEESQPEEIEATAAEETPEATAAEETPEATAAEETPEATAPETEVPENASSNEKEEPSNGTV